MKQGKPGGPEDLFHHLIPSTLISWRHAWQVWRNENGRRRGWQQEKVSSKILLLIPTSLVWYVSKWYLEYNQSINCIIESNYSIHWLLVLELNYSLVANFLYIGGRPTDLKLCSVPHCINCCREFTISTLWESWFHVFIGSISRHASCKVEFKSEGWDFMWLPFCWRNCRIVEIYTPALISPCNLWKGFDQYTFHLVMRSAR